MVRRIEGAGGCDGEQGSRSRARRRTQVHRSFAHGIFHRRRASRNLSRIEKHSKRGALEHSMISGLFRFSAMVCSLHNVTYAKLRYSKKMAAVGTFVGVMVFLGAGGAALAQDAPGASPASAGAV